MKTFIKGFLLLSALNLFFAQKSVFAQCGPTMVNATVLYYPDTVANLPVAVNGNSYLGVLQFYVPASISGVPITSVTVNSVTGLAASFAYSLSPTSGTVLANNAGCIIITSNLVNEAIGTYPILINVTAVSPFGTFPQTLTGYKIKVNNPANPNTTFSSINASICSGNTYNFNNASLNSSGTYLDTLVNYLGSDSIITLHLLVNANSNKTINDSICAGMSYTFGATILNNPGTYTNTLTNYLGCDSIITLHLKVNPMPGTPSITQNGCTLTCDTNAFYYQWYNAGTPIPSTNSKNFTMNNGTGLYSVQITNMYGCSQTSAQMSYTCATGMNELNNSSFVQIVPNPFQSELQINLDPQIKKGDIIVLNSLGQVIKTKKFENGNSQKMDLHDLSDGVYYVQLKSAQTVQAIRIIKTH